MKNKQILTAEIPSIVKDIRLMDFAERFKNIDLLKPITPAWWWWQPCEVNVLLVADRFLHFGTNDFGLSEFIKTFSELEKRSNVHIRYKVTLAHRQDPSNTSRGIDPMLLQNNSIVGRITDFKFDTSVNLSKFDQVWIFTTGSRRSNLPEDEQSHEFSTLSRNEVSVINAFMKNGGGVFATGDHGNLGRELGISIPIVSGMRIWEETPETNMTGNRRNDTNRPAAGAQVSNQFDNQSDNIPQEINVQQFGFGLPHQLLSVSRSIVPSGKINIMPDHPHEGECTPAQFFLVEGSRFNNLQFVASQVIATSDVLAGSTAPGKLATQAHSFPSISVFDGSVAGVGRIVIDSTWHHFVNINLNGAGTNRGGLDADDFRIIQNYFMNIATWVTKPKRMLCVFKRFWFDFLLESQVIEASLNEPDLKLEEIKLADLNSIGMLAKEILADKYNPAFAYEFMIRMIELADPKLYNQLNIWQPTTKQKDEKKSAEPAPQEGFDQALFNLEPILGTAVGSGLIAIRDHLNIYSGDFNEKSLNGLEDIFTEGASYGLHSALKHMQKEFKALVADGFSKK